MRIIGKRRAGRALRVIVAAATDKGSGRAPTCACATATARASSSSASASAAATATGAGRYTLKVTVDDVAGNRRVKKVKLRIT